MYWYSCPLHSLGHLWYLMIVPHHILCVLNLIWSQGYALHILLSPHLMDTFLLLPLGRCHHSFSFDVLFASRPIGVCDNSSVFLSLSFFPETVNWSSLKFSVLLWKTMTKQAAYNKVILYTHLKMIVSCL